jgi:Holliday junction resolvase RusA-like endonuclease
MTKKTSNQVVHSGPKCRGCHRGIGRPFVLPSSQSKAWTKSAVKQMLAQIAAMKGRVFPIAHAVNCRALIYRERAVGDAVNFYQAVADALQEGGVLANDRLIVSWNGSELLKDAANPRILIELTALA